MRDDNAPGLPRVFAGRRRNMGNGSVSEPFRLSFGAALAVVGALAAGPAIAQDYDAGKTPPQLFASDCSACHNKPGGLAKGMSRSALASFLKEHYTSKQESAEALAGYLLGAGPGDAKQEKADNPAGPKSKTRKAEREGEPKSDPKTREPAIRSEDEGANQEAPKRPRVADREAPKGPGEAVLSKLRYYGAARGEAKDTARLRNPAQRLETYANSGSATVAPDVAAHDDAAPSAKRKTAEKKKKKDTDAPVSAATERPPQPHRPAPARQATGNN